MDKNTSSQQLLRVPEVAQLLGLKESTVRAWLLARRLSKVRVGRWAVRVPLSEVERIISEGLIPAKEERR